MTATEFMDEAFRVAEASFWWRPCALVRGGYLAPASSRMG